MNRRGNAESESSEEDEDTNDDRDSTVAGITADHSKGNVQQQQQQQLQRADHDSTNNNSGETRVTNAALASRLHITNKSLK